MKKVIIPAKEITLYKFDELNKDVKNKLLENHREKLYKYGYAWEDELLNSLKAAADAFNIEIEEDYYGNFYVSSIPDMNPDKMNFKRAIAYINNHYEFKKLSYQIRQKLKYMKNRLSADSIYPVTEKYYEDNMLTGYCADYCILEAYEDFINQQKKRHEYNAANLTLADFFIILCNHFEKEKDSDREYQESEECYAELVNGLWFLKNGDIYKEEI